MKTSKALKQAAVERSNKFYDFAKSNGYPFDEETLDMMVITMANMIVREFINGAQWQLKQQREKKKKASKQ